MERNLKIVIIGGSACGPKAAARARRISPDARITVLEQGEYVSVASCGLPYYISGVIEKESSLIVRRPDYFKNVMDVDVLTGMRAVAIDRESHTIEALDGKSNEKKTFEYDKLVISTGATPKMPPLPGRDLKNVFTLSKIEDANVIKNAVTSRRVKKAVIIGAGLIGMEMAEAFTHRGLETTVIESLNWPLPALLDMDIGLLLEKYLRAKGIKLALGERVAALEDNGEGYVKSVTTVDNRFDADIVLLAIGTAPNVKLAKDAGLFIGQLGGIAVNQFLETSDPDIYAGGDCVENVNLVTGNKTLAPLGSTANKHGRVIGTNITGGGETFPGVLATSVVKIFDYNVARTGLTEGQCTGGLEAISALIPAPDRANYYPGNKEMVLRLIADRKTGRVVGAQAIGEGEVAKRIDVIATAITFGATVENLTNLDLAYAPPYNTAMDPVHNAASVIRNKMSGLAKAVTSAEVRKKMDAGEKFVLLDVRNPDEFEKARIECHQGILIPLPELRKNLAKLPKDAEIVVLCRSSVRAYQAQRILVGAGYGRVTFVEGSILGWPYEVCTLPTAKQ
jgi:NADPH-dependent 2,4-dienoyl-CoA reductase/sulfur reductase-like enzyme/rhodanese-related sulfurtransferase